MHGFAVGGNVVARQSPESGKQPAQRDRHKHVDPGVAGPVGELVVADKKGADGGGQHDGDPGIAGRPVQPGALLAAPAGPDGNRPQRHGSQRCSEVDGNNRAELHGGGLRLRQWRDCAPTPGPCPPVYDGMRRRWCEMRLAGASRTAARGQQGALMR